MPHTIEQQIKATYFALRAGAALIAFVFPLLLWGGGKLAGFTLRDSMSAYYWATPAQLCPCKSNPDGTCIKEGTKAEVSLTQTPREQAIQPGTMRTWFVGLLFAIGIILYVNQGHSKMEDVFLNLAGMLAWGVAIFPMNWDCFHHSFSLHGFCAISFFICIAIISAFFSRNTLVLIKDPKVRARYRLTYQVLGISMFASPLAAYGFNFITSQHSPVYWAEFNGDLGVRSLLGGQDEGDAGAGYRKVDHGKGHEGGDLRRPSVHSVRLLTCPSTRGPREDGAPRF